MSIIILHLKLKAQQRQQRQRQQQQQQNKMTNGKNGNNALWCDGKLPCVYDMSLGFAVWIAFLWTSCKNTLHLCAIACMCLCLIVCLFAGHNVRVHVNIHQRIERNLLVTSQPFPIYRMSMLHKRQNVKQCSLRSYWNYLFYLKQNIIATRVISVYVTTIEMCSRSCMTWASTTISNELRPYFFFPFTHRECVAHPRTR